MSSAVSFGRLLLLIFVLGSLGTGDARAQAEQSCADHEGFQRLNFWFGTWIVHDRASGKTVGTNRIKPILDGCAIQESWQSGRGGEGRSLFYYVPATDTWKQVWVTDRALRPGGVKEKTLVETTDAGGVRFQGTIPLPDGGSYLDRTTLTPLPDGRVRQVIERSTDGGNTWETGFDAVYVPSDSLSRQE